jgi:hypothetical protein
VCAQVAKRVVLKGEWRTLPARSDRVRILMAVKSQARWALLPLRPGDVDALVALGKEVSSGTCHWDAARIVRGPGKPELERDEVTLALLGQGCQRCRIRWAAAEVAERERAHVRNLVAAGYAPEDAAYQRPGDLRATGAIWPAGKEPSGLTAAARQAARKVPPPSYYIPGRSR